MRGNTIVSGMIIVNGKPQMFGPCPVGLLLATLTRAVERAEAAGCCDACDDGLAVWSFDITDGKQTDHVHLCADCFSRADEAAKAEGMTVQNVTALVVEQASA